MSCATAVLSLGTALLTAVPVVAAPAAWEQIVEGLEVRTHVGGDGTVGPAWAVLVRIDPRSHRLRVLASPTGEASLRAAAVARSQGAWAVVNGGFFDSGGRSIGWLVSDGRELSPVRTEGWGVFYVRDDGTPAILHASRARGVLARQAVQAGPRLVVGGRVNRLEPQLARRSFVGIDDTGRIVLGCTGPFPVGAVALATFLATPTTRGGLGLVHALNLDGGSSAQMFVRRPGGEDISLPGGVAVPNVLAVFPAEPEG